MGFEVGNVVEGEELLNTGYLAMKQRRDALVVRRRGEWFETVSSENGGAEEFGA